MVSNRDPYRMTYEEAVALVPETDWIEAARYHEEEVMRTDLTRRRLLQKLLICHPERPGPIALERGYGIVLVDGSGPLFIKTRSE